MAHVGEKVDTKASIGLHRAKGTNPPAKMSLHDALNALAPIALGATAWFSVQFVGRQIARFYELRAEAVELLYFFANLIPEDRDRTLAAHDELRRCAARFNALHHSLTPLTRWFLSWRRYNLEKAVKGLTGFSNSLRAKGYQRAWQQSLVEVGLCLPRSYTDEDLKVMKQLDN